ncbi:unnamed protein product [Schistosoma margrebowiei]|nr:unnamed protein product [Schistosoma margrebowiei]
MPTCLNISNVSIPMLVNMSENANHSNCNYTTICLPDSNVQSGLILTLIGLVLGFIIITNRKLHTISTKNSFFIVITMIFNNVGVGLLISFAKWYDQFSSISIATALLIIAIFLGSKLNESQKKWTIFLFAVCGGFVFTGFILMVLWLTLKTIGLLVAILVCWCGAVFIVIIFTTYNLEKYHEQEQISTLFSVFVLMYENSILLIGLLFILNSIIECEGKDKFLNETENGRNNFKIFH